MSSGKHLYRSLLRELRLASTQLRATRNPDVNNQIRQIVSSSGDAQNIQRAMAETRDFLRANRIYTELLKRYNPTHDMSQEERIHATARRVGLDSPLEYKKQE